MNRILLLAALLTGSACCCRAEAAPLALVREGHLNCAVILTTAPPPSETAQVDKSYGDVVFLKEGKLLKRFEAFAAEELALHLKKVASGELKVVKVETRGQAEQEAAAMRQAGLVPIILGDVLSGDAGRRLIADKGGDHSAFLLRAGDGLVEIIGLTPLGVLNGSYELLEQLGFRWFMAGELGLVLPEGKDLALPEQVNVQVPSFPGRLVDGGWIRVSHPDWSRRLRGRHAMLGSTHDIIPFVPSARRKSIFAEHPEYFALINGQRQCRQLCISNPDVLRLTIEAAREHFKANPGTMISLNPNDGGGFCECANCRALDPDIETPFKTPAASMTDRYIWFANRVLKALDKEFPDARVYFLAYNATVLPPVKVKADPRIKIMAAAIHSCRFHAAGNPICPERDFWPWMIKEWQKQTEVASDFSYWYNLADGGFPYGLIGRVREEIAQGRELGLKNWIGQFGYGWSTTTPLPYITAKLMWNDKADVDALLQDFYDKFYGPASSPMKKYHTLLEETLKNADYHTGSSWDVPFIYTAAVRHKGRSFLNEAARLAGRSGSPAYAKRVSIFRKSFDYMEAFVDMMERRNRHDYTGAMAALLRMRGLHKSLSEDYDVKMATPSSAGIREDFWGKSVEEGYARTTGNNQLAAALGNRWQFMLDPQAMGGMVGLYRPEIKGGNWQEIDTSTAWSNQGLRYYFGQTWYRQSVVIPEKFKGQKISLWFAGVDDTVDVWVNGHLVGSNHKGAVFDLDAFGAALVPFEFDATEAVLFGRENVVTVRHARERSNEIGTGGIMGPVIFYAAK